MKKIISTSLLLFLVSCTSNPKTNFDNYEEYQLDNGLTVILHQDDSDPLVAIATVVHVGSNRENLEERGLLIFLNMYHLLHLENTPNGAHRLYSMGWTKEWGYQFDFTYYYGGCLKMPWKNLHG